MGFRTPVSDVRGGCRWSPPEAEQARRALAWTRKNLNPNVGFESNADEAGMCQRRRLFPKRTKTEAHEYVEEVEVALFADITADRERVGSL